MILVYVIKLNLFIVIHLICSYIWYRKVIVSYILSNFKFVYWSRITSHEVYWRFDILAYPEISSNAIWIHMQITNALLLVEIRKSFCAWFPIDHGFDTTLSRYNNILECVISTSVDRISIVKSIASDKSWNQWKNFMYFLFCS